MLTRTIGTLVLGLTLGGCDGSDPPTGGTSTDGTLVVSTTTGGADPDQDGYVLVVDGTDTLALDPTGTAELEVPPGRHVLRLLGVAEQCSVFPGATLDVYVPRGTTTPAAFEIACPVTGARITVHAIGLDFDPEGYRVVVDGSDRGRILADGGVLVRLEPGNRTIDLTGLTPNCAVDGPDSRAVTIVDQEVARIEFAVVCTATSGVIGVSILGSGAGAVFEVTVDGARAFRVSALQYLKGVSAGEHVVSLSGPDNCAVETEPQSVTVTTGTLTRDTVEVAFSATCETAFRVTAPTTGTIPRSDYSVWLCYSSGSCSIYDLAARLGTLAPNDTLLAQVRPGTYRLLLSDLPSNCFISVLRNPTREITIGAGQLLTAAFAVECS